MDNSNDAQILINLIREITNQEIDKRNFDYTYFGKIKKNNEDTTCDVELFSENGIYAKIPNKTGENLEVGDSVLIRVRNNNFSNAYIDIRNGIHLNPEETEEE